MNTLKNGSIVIHNSTGSIGRVQSLAKKFARVIWDAEPAYIAEPVALENLWQDHWVAMTQSEYDQIEYDREHGI